jgi:hypothetical protein
MTEKEAWLTILLQAWWGFFDEKCVTSQEVLDLANDEASMRARYDALLATSCENERQKLYQWFALRGALDHLAATKITGGDLDNILDEMKNEVVGNFVVERDGSCVQPVKWRVVKQEREYRRMTDDERETFLAARKEAGLKIDPATAEVHWSYGQTLDPYGIDRDLPEELQQVGRQYFARTPGNDIWVSFYDLPDETRDALEKSRSKDDDFPWLWLRRNKPAHAGDN